MAMSPVTKKQGVITPEKLGTELPPMNPPRRHTSPIMRTIQYVIVIAISAFVMLPFVWMFLASFKTESEFGLGDAWLPEEWQWNNYVDVFDLSSNYGQQAGMSTWIVNTVIVAVAITVLQVITGSFAAYGFSRIKFPGRDVLFLVYIGTISVPWQAYMIPQFLMISEMGLVDTLAAIILLQTFGAFGVFLMKQFYDTIPEELSEAARIDGLSEYGIYWRIMLPLSTPSIASLAILTFTHAWNDYMGPLLYLRNRDLYTIQLGLQSFVQDYQTNYAMIMTGSVISVLPIAIVFFIGQRYFVQGIATSGMKG